MFKESLKVITAAALVANLGQAPADETRYVFEAEQDTGR